MSLRGGSVPAGLTMVTAIFLGIVGGALGAFYSYPLLQAASNSTSNLTRSLYTEALKENLNYTVQQVQGIIRQTAYSIIAVSAFLVVLGVVAWLFAYRPASTGQYGRASQGAMFTGVLFILASLAGTLYTGLFAIVAGALLLVAWYRLRTLARSATGGPEGLQAGEGNPGVGPGA